MPEMSSNVTVKGFSDYYLWFYHALQVVGFTTAYDLEVIIKINYCILFMTTELLVKLHEHTFFILASCFLLLKMPFCIKKNK